MRLFLEIKRGSSYENYSSFSLIVTRKKTHRLIKDLCICYFTVLISIQDSNTPYHRRKLVSQFETPFWKGLIHYFR